MRLFLTIVFLLLISTVMAYAQQGYRCGHQEAIEGNLAGKYQETPLAVFTNRDRTFTLWANPDTGTWSLTFSPSPDVVCFYGTGDSFTFPTPTPLGDDL